MTFRTIEMMYFLTNIIVITNGKDFIHKISYKDDLGYKNIRELIWKDMRCSTMDSRAREESCKENMPINK